MTFHTFHIRQPEADQGIYYGDSLDASYRGFRFSKTPMYQLYFVVPPEGKQLPTELASQFTQLVILQKAIDRWYESNPSGWLADIPLPAPRRVHRKKQDMEDEGKIFEASDD
jgi:hypothetical protein